MELKKFSDKIQLIMDKHQLNASSFAEKIGVGRSSLSHILSGRNKPSLDFVMSVLAHFDDINFEWFTSDSDRYPDPKNPNITQSKISPSEEKTASTPTPSQLNSSMDKEVDHHKAYQTSTGNSESGNIQKGKNISKVILFYEDGTFESFTP